MIRFSALNKEDSNTDTRSLTTINNKPSSQQPTKEAKESAVLQLYHEALKQQQCGHLNEAKSLYTDILNSNIVANDENGSLERVKFVILKNLASIAKENGDMSTAVTAYLEASKLDSSDLMVWYQLSLVANTLGDCMIMRNSLEQCLKCNEQYWPAVNLYFTVLLALQDYYACLQTALYILKIDPHYSTGLSLLHHLATVCPEYIYYEPQIRNFLDKSTPNSTLLNKLLIDVQELRRKHELLQSVSCLPESIFSNSKLKPVSFSTLGQWLIGIYNDCINKSLKTHQPSLTASVSLYNMIEEIQEVNTMPPSQELLTINKDVATVSEKKKRPHNSELDQWITAPKRRSSRVKAKEKEAQDYFELVKNYIPSQLEITHLPSELSCFPSLIKRIEKNENKFSELKQLNEETLICLSEVWKVKSFLQSHLSNNGVVHLIKDFLSDTAVHYDKQWLKTDVDVFINCYELVYSHLNFPPLFCQLSDNEHLYGTLLFQISLCYCELKIDSIITTSKTHSSSLPSSLCQSFHYIQHYFTNDKKASIRVEWLKGRLFAWQRNKIKAIEMYTKCQSLLVVMDTKGFLLKLPNCSMQESIISEVTVNEKIESLKQLLSLEQVKVAYDKEEYDNVIDILTPVLSQDSYKEVFLSHLIVKNNNNNLHSIMYLLESYYKLNRKIDCIFYSTHFLMELLIYYQEEGMTDEWPKTLSYVYSTIDRCTVVLEVCTMTVLQLLVMCIIKTFYVFHELWDNSSHLPVMLPWKLLHVIISFDKWNQDNNEMECTPPVSATNTTIQTENLSPLPPSPSLCIPSLSPPIPSLSPSHCVIDDPMLADVLADLTPLSLPVVSDTPTQSITVPPTQSITIPPTHSTDISSSPPPQSIPVTPTQFIPVPPTQSIPVSPTHSAAVLPTNISFSPPTQSITVPPTITVSSLALPITVSSSSPPTQYTSIMSTPPTHFTSVLSAPPTLISVSPFNTSVDITSNSLTSKNKGLCFLKLAHTQLGSYSWCCHDNGSFLHYIVSKLRPQLKELTNLTSDLRELLLPELEQCYYCLYGYPYKKGKLQRGLTEHSSNQVKMEWSGALMLIEYYHPHYLPVIDDVKSPQITPELITLYKKVIDVVPKEGQVVSEKDLQEYINESINDLPTLPPNEHSSIISEIYYLLADDSLKLMDNGKAIKYYQLTLCYCCTRFDSWAGLALAKSRKLTERLDKSDISSTVEKLVLNNVKSVIRCFLEALKLNSGHCYIVEKFGFFCYAIQSFASQITKLPQLYMSKDTIGWNEKMILDHLELAHDQFSHALTLKESSHAEPWIYHFILGKIYWKQKKSLGIVLNHLVQSAETLHSEGAAYPLTIEVASKGHAIEALEVHYQFMSMALKALLSSTDNTTTTNAIIKEKLSLMSQLPLGRLHYLDIWKWTLNILKKYNTSYTNDTTMIFPYIEATQLSITDTSSISNETELSDMMTERWNNIDPLRECLYGVAVCTVKFPAYFKPLYRLASALYDMNQPEEAKKFLLGPLPECFTVSQDKSQPIFALKNNIFQNMWQIQTEEINRPGSFSTHARSCLQLLLRVLETLNDFTSLVYVAQQLKSKPDHSKQFMREAERPVMYVQVLHSSVRALKSIINNLNLSLLECHRTLINANILKNLLTKAEGRKDESVKNVEQYMMTIFSTLWSDVQVRALFIKEGFTLPHEPTIELCNKYCTTYKDKDHLTFLN